ncbi:MAG: M16 family metallopeptidase [Candidatus Acidiferrales bacterium]
MSTTPQTQTQRTTPPGLGAERPVAWPARTVRKLVNGLEIVLVELRAFPKISAQLFFRSGNAEVAHRSPGLAEMTAAVVRTGTEMRSSRRIEEDLRRIGADLGTSSGADTTAISISGLSEFASELLEIVADLARNASFPQEEVEREKRQRIEELKVERATPEFLASERFRRVIFGEHPYAIIAPKEENIRAYRREELIAFYGAHYVPANGLLVAVGDFRSEEIFDRIEKIFGAWQAPRPAETARPEPPQHRGRKIALVHLPEKVQTVILVGNRAITRHSPDWHRLMLANAIFGGAFNSRLVMNIREQKGYTYSPRSGVTSLRQHGYFSVQAAVRNEVVAATLTEIFYELDRMRALPVGEEELADARNYLSGVFSLGIATQDGILGQLSTVFLEHLPGKYLEEYRERVRALTATDVTTAARKYFDSANAQIVVVGDRERIAAQAALFGEITEYDAQGNRK